MCIKVSTSKKRPTAAHLDEAESDVVFANVLVRGAEEGRGRDAQEVPLLGQPLDEPVVAEVVRLRAEVDLRGFNKIEVVFFKPFGLFKVKFCNYCNDVAQLGIAPN